MTDDLYYLSAKSSITGRIRPVRYWHPIPKLEIMRLKEKLQKRYPNVLYRVTRKMEGVRE